MNPDGIVEEETIYCECGKRCYTKRYAQYSVNYCNSKHRRRKSTKHKKPQRCYYCELCGYWHLTSKNSYREW